jgi:hypothetical protein
MISFGKVFELKRKFTVEKKQKKTIHHPIIERCSIILMLFDQKRLMIRFSIFYFSLINKGVIRIFWILSYQRKFIKGNEIISNPISEYIHIRWDGSVGSIPQRTLVYIKFMDISYMNSDRSIIRNTSLWESVFLLRVSVIYAPYRPII